MTWIASASRVSTWATQLFLPAAVVVLLVAVWLGAASAVVNKVVVWIAIAAGIGWFGFWPVTHDMIATSWAVPAVVAGVIAMAAVSLVLCARIRVGTAAAVAIGAALVSYVTTVLSGRPLIDVWVILQQSARGLCTGQNPYEMSFSGIPAGQMDWCFNYMPVTFLATAPGEWLFGDVRWVEAACLAATTGLLCWHVANRFPLWRKDDRVRYALAVVVGSAPGTLFMVQQSWTELLLVLGITSAAVLLDRGRPNWAMIPFGLALATKQHLVILLPLLLFWPSFGWWRVLGTGAVAGAVTLPWLVINPTRFTRCTVDFFLNHVGPPSSQSMWQVLAGPLRMPLLLVVTVVAVVIVLLRCPRTASGFLMAAGTVLATFSVFNKQSFPNQYWLAAALVIASLAIAPRPAAATT